MSSMTTRVSRQALAVAWLCFLILSIVSGSLADETGGSELTRNSASRRLQQSQGEPYTACVAGQVPSWATSELPEGGGSWRDLQELVETIGNEGEAEEWRVFDLQGRTLSAAQLGGGNGAGGPDADLVFFSVVPSRHGMYKLPAGRTILRNGTLVLPLNTGLRFEGPGQLILDKVEVRWPSTAASLPLGGGGGPPLEGSEWPHRGSAALEFRGPGLQVWLNSVAVRAVHEEEARPPTGAIANGGADGADGNGISGSFLLVAEGQEDVANAVVSADELPPPLHAAVVASSGTALSLTCGAISNRGGAHSLAARDAGTVVRASYASFRDSVASGVAVLDGAAAVLEQCAVLSVGGAAEGAVSAGVVLTGNGSAHMEGSSVEACDTGVSVGAGSRLQMNRCAVLDSRRDAAAVAGGGALFFAKSSVFRDGGRYGVAAQNAAGVRMQRCLFSRNERDGVWAAGADTLVVGSGLRSSRNSANGIRAEAGASVTLSGSHVDLNAGNGAHAVQAGSVLQASDTSFRSNGGTGVMARGRGQATLQGCSLLENNGSGLLAAGPGSAASAGASSFLGNAEWGAAARHGGEVKLTACTAELNGFAGLAAHNSTSQLSAADTTAVNNPVGGVDVAFGGGVSAQFCNFSANGRVGASVVGLESQLDLDGSEARGNGWYGLYAAEAAALGFSSGTLSGNGRGGGRVEGFATRAVLQSAGVLGNGGPGFVLEASARLSLLDSIVTDNSGPGLLGSGPQTALNAEASRVARNEQHGLFLTDHATATLGGACNLSSNGWSGAWLEESSSLFAEASIFDGNQDAGIGAASGATVIVTAPQGSSSEMASCSLSHNRQASGMDATGRGTRVSVLRCMLQGNGEMGAVVAGRAQGSVSGCQVVDNDSFGVLVRDTGSFAAVSGTTIAGNELGSAVGLYGGRLTTDTVTASRCDPAC